ncbi:MAG TPA: ATP-binding cassette domain-containing protein [Bacillota bacterium]|nr:ATP-binding cassette domain-containing protein [Bacillota bacterium]HOK67971.1 ATP-binding cassette domain-containing protein [Bacillota bacterium]HPP84362.1 ATP-binding cassette domain-containing protein [Bacillota bacterium]
MIEILNVTKKFGDKVAVDNLSFNVVEGEILGFLGPNGAGKSTTMNIITGYLSATSGTAKIDGIDILENPIEAKRRIGFLPEIPPLYPEMTVKEYLGFVYELKECRFPKEQHLKEICDVVKIGDVYKRMIKNLSKGYRQRVGIAQALIGNPKVLIFDEPTIGLDPKQIIEIRNLIKMLGKEHTVILSTHILPEVQAVCDRIVVINKGKLVANEKTEDLILAVEGSRRLTAKIVGPEAEVLKMLKSTPGVRYAESIGKRDTDSISYIIESEDNVDVRKSLFFNLAKNNWPLIGLEGDELNLEDIFIRLIDKEKSDKKKRGAKKG